MVDNKLIQQYAQTIENPRTKANHISVIRKYLRWRNSTAEEVIKNGLAEKKLFERFLNDTSFRNKKKSRVTELCTVKKFLVFHGVPFVKFERKSQGLKYANDPYMKKFLTLSGTKKKTKTNTNYQLAKYCDFRNMSPTDLIEEAKKLENNDIELLLKEFYDSLELKTRESFIFTIARFYKKFIKIYGEIIPHVIKTNSSRKKSNLRMGFDKKLVDKQVIKQLLEVSDLRDSMIIMAMWESGLNPVDLVSLNVGDFKDYLNLATPEEINHVAVIPHTREKNNVAFLACFGQQTLRLMSKWFNLMKKELEAWDVNITDETPIITMKVAPYERLDNRSVYFVIKKACIKASFDELFNCSDFRNSFNTRAKEKLKHYDKELFMGHVGGIERHYDISDLDYFQQEYQKAWEILFDLTFEHERIVTVEEENREIKAALTLFAEENKKMKNELDKAKVKLAYTETIIEKILKALPAGNIGLSREDLEKTVEKSEE